MDVLAHLVERGLAARVDGAGGPAFLLLPAARAEARRLLVDAGELDAAEAVHTRAVLDLAATRGAAVDGALGDLAAAELTRSEADLRVALDRLTGRGQLRDGLRLACALVPFVLRRGYDGLVGPALTSLLHQSRDGRLDVVPDTGAPSGPADPGDGGDRWLTRRERDVLGQLATGATNKEIAARLGLTPKTVMHHSTAVYRKLGVRGRADATAWAFRHGVVS